MAGSGGSEPAEPHVSNTDHLVRDDSSRRLPQHAAAGATVSEPECSSGSGHSAPIDDNHPPTDEFSMDARSPDSKSSDDELLGDYMFAARQKIRDSQEDSQTEHPVIDDASVGLKVCAPPLQSSSHVEGINASEHIISAPQKDIASAVIGSTIDAHGTGIRVIKKKKLRSLRERHNAVLDIVVADLSSGGVVLVPPTVPTSTCGNRKDLPAPKKLTPKWYNHHLVYIFSILQGW